MAVAHATERPEPPSSLGTEIPEELEAIVMRCLEKDKEKRPQSAAQLAQQIVDTSLAEQWTQNQRERWWLENLPELCMAPTLTSQPPMHTGTVLEPAE